MHLRDTGMPLSDIAVFTRLVQEDPDGVLERLQPLLSHRHVVLEAMARLKTSLDVIDGKIADYELRLRPQSGIGQEASVEIANEL